MPHTVSTLQGGQEEDHHPGRAHHFGRSAAGPAADAVRLLLPEASQVQGEDGTADGQDDWL